MAISFHWFWGLFLLLLSLYFIPSHSTYHVHIVYLGLPQVQDPLLTTKSHLHLLSNVFSSEQAAKDSLLYSYKHSFSGFSARLNSTQAATLAKMEGVISVFRSKTLRLHTTRSWDFLGLTLDHSKGTPFQLTYGDDVVVGIFDTGIWPESESFREEPGIRPIPSCWKGKCVKGDKFEPSKACNRKLIGARYYVRGFEDEFGPLNTTGPNAEYRSARDVLGHGTHTASTAVGSVVNNASFLGLGLGKARGGAPRARLAVYKTCWKNGLDGSCSEADVLAAFDDALCDGVHVISVSFGAGVVLLPFFASSAAIGSFHASQLGVTVVFSAGNDGPTPGLVENVSPWGISVAASTIDRSFPTLLSIDNNAISIVGQSFNVKQMKLKLVDASNYFFDGVCTRDNWRGKRASGGKLFLCISTMAGSSLEAQVAARIANASALLIAEPMTTQLPEIDILPTILIDINQGTQISHYYATSPKLPIVQIMPSDVTIRQTPAPTLAYFSSRGPTSLSTDILKPDVSAPGVGILAAWPPQSPPSGFPFDHRSVNWNFQSGTSMSCPHVSGVVALIKSLHPKWSPAAIRSALMTTAYTKDAQEDEILAGGSMEVADAFDIGAGHINPLRAIDPGLVYDLNTEDYIVFLCNIGYSKEQIESLVLTPASSSVETDCSEFTYLNNNNNNTSSTNAAAHLNYPSITVSDLRSTVTIKRTVRNEGGKRGVYFVRVENPKGVDVWVWPRILVFRRAREEISYYVTLTPLKQSQGRYDFGEIVWSDGFHQVRSPLVVSVNTTTTTTDHEEDFITTDSAITAQYST
ncbi:subtilisin-like protease SBT3.18 [Telopea speciosissima]|uniref:subtilisin-like protease SBT3.18 n=1 Tax=Telopea speciosissima TaxID=54955 RepID=UPI001CC52BF1|nr:subtilisin-like protease SBT3.18 [Telopea speciosissima]